MMPDLFVPLEIGQRVITPSGSRGVVYSLPRRAVADIRRAASERRKDLNPYTVKLDSDGSFVLYRGHELDLVS